VVLGFFQGANSEMTGPINEQADRALLWRFLLCWFVPGFLLLTFGIKLKSHHYAFPILPPLTIPAAVGMDYFVRRQTERRQPPIWPIFLIGCIAAAMIVRSLPAIPAPMKQPIVDLIEIFAVGGLLALHWERARAPGRMKFAYFVTAWAIAIGVQSWVMPAQDDFRYQADLAKLANGKTPPGDIIYMLGHREEEQEAEYAYYLRFPMKRLISINEVPRGTDPIYAIAPTGLLPELNGATTLSICQGLRPHETESDRLRLVRITRSSTP
jgi:4-amino-4-deoxy-L-arabinose transferase-like glycosyltransferase